jgi:hypothetical protein
MYYLGEMALKWGENRISMPDPDGSVEKQGVKISLLFIATNSTAIEIFLKILKQFNSAPIRRAVIPFCFDSPSGESGPKNVASLHFSTGPSEKIAISQEEFKKSKESSSWLLEIYPRLKLLTFFIYTLS